MSHLCTPLRDLKITGNDALPSILMKYHEYCVNFSTFRVYASWLRHYIGNASVGEALDRVGCKSKVSSRLKASKDDNTGPIIKVSPNSIAAQNYYKRCQHQCRSFRLRGHEVLYVIPFCFDFRCTIVSAAHLHRSVVPDVTTTNKHVRAAVSVLTSIRPSHGSDLSSSFVQMYIICIQ